MWLRPHRMAPPKGESFMSVSSGRHARAMRAAVLLIVAALPALVLAAPANAATSKQIKVNVSSGVRCINVDVTEDQVAGIPTDGTAGWKDTNFHVTFGDSITVSTWTGDRSSNGRRCDGKLVKRQAGLAVPTDNLTNMWVDLS
jgi:hypothetical protein